MKEIVNNLLDKLEYSEGGITSREIFKNETLDVTLFSMAAGTSMSEHTSTKEGIVYVLEGRGVFRLEGEDISMDPGTFIHMKKNAVHSINANLNTSFMLVLLENKKDKR